MKHAALLVSTLALAACQIGNATTSSAASGRDLVSSLYAAFAKGDTATIASALAPDVDWRTAQNFLYADGSPYRGPEAVVGQLGRVQSEWTGYTLTLDSVFESGNRVVALGRYTGRYNATGASIDAQFAHVWTLRDGKVVAFQQYTDTLQFAQATSAKRAAKAESVGPADGQTGKTKAAKEPRAGKSGKKKKAKAKDTKGGGRR